MRNLATIQKIKEIAPIEGADKVEKATVLGWEIVIRKGEFKVGDLCVYVEVDSILPHTPDFEFMRERKFRVKTIKLRGQVSQGICFPLSVIPNYARLKPSVLSVGLDVTESIGIVKYDPEAELERKEMERIAGVSKNRMDKFMRRYKWYRGFIFKPSRLPFPAFIRKTDEPRVQLLPNIIEKSEHLQFEVTEKIDGQSATYFVIKNPKTGFFRKKWLFGVCSRNFQLLAEDNGSYWTMAKQHNLKENMTNYCINNNVTKLVIQGEIIGTKIQGNKYNVKDFAMFIFNVIFADKKNGETQMDIHQLEFFCSSMKLYHVPFLEYMYLPKSIPELVEYAKGRSTINLQTPREGVVIRNYEKGISFKVINPDFLLKYDL